MHVYMNISNRLMKYRIERLMWSNGGSSDQHDKLNEPMNKSTCKFDTHTHTQTRALEEAESPIEQAI